MYCNFLVFDSEYMVAIETGWTEGLWRACIQTSRLREKRRYYENENTQVEASYKQEAAPGLGWKSGPQSYLAERPRKFHRRKMMKAVLVKLSFVTSQ